MGGAEFAMFHHGGCCCSFILLVLTIAAISLPLIAEYDKGDTEIKFGLWHVCYKHVPVSGTITNPHNNKTDVWHKFWGEVDEWSCIDTDELDTVGASIAPKGSSASIQSTALGIFDLDKGEEMYDIIVRLQWLNVCAIVSLWLAGCCGGAVYKHYQAGYASALMHFLAGLLFLATGSYIVDKIDYPDDWSWDFSFIMVWLAWLLCWLTAVLNVCGAIAMGRDSHSEHETEHISGDHTRYDQVQSEVKIANA